MNRYRLTKAGVNVNEALHRLDNDKELYEELIHSFLTDTHYEQMCEAIEEKNAKQAFLCAHSLKGVAGNLSFITLYEALVPLVEKLRNRDLENIEAYLQPVQAAYKLLIEVL